MSFNDTPAGSAGPVDPMSDAATGHVYWRVLAALTSPAGAWPFDDVERARVTQHLAACEDCRAQLSALENAMLGHTPEPPTPAPDPAPDIQPETQAHSDIGQIPDDATLANYVTTLATLGRAAATRRYRAVARHITACATCQEAVSEISDGLEEDAIQFGSDSGAPVSPLPQSPDPQSWWRRVTNATWRLNSPFQIDVRPQWLDVLHELPQLLIPASLAPSAHFRGPTRSAGAAPRSQGLTVDLRDDNAIPHQWVRVTVKLRAEYSRRLSGELIYTWFQASGAQQPAAGIPWSIDWDPATRNADPPPDTSLSASPPSARLRAGATSAKGISRFYLDHGGRYILSSEVEHSLWIVPFTIHHLPNDTLERYSDSSRFDASRFVTQTDLDAPEASDTAIGNLMTAWDPDQEAANVTTINGAFLTAHRSPQEPPPASVEPFTGRSLFHIGQRLTDYAGTDITIARMASGGFGMVAMGPDNAAGAWRALKVLRADVLAQASARGGSASEHRMRSLFLREALTWRGLWPHPNLITAQGVTQINGQPALVLDYAEQGSLRDLFETIQRQGRWLTTAFALRLAQQIAAGLLALHTPEPDLLRPDPIVHRDLKPENILLSHGQAKITDFGLAKAVAEALGSPDDAVAESDPDSAELAMPAPHGQTQPSRAQAGAALGTPAYMAPEQWLDPSQTGAPADAYALGIILAESLTSRHPLLSLDQPHTLAEWRQAHTTGRPTTLRHLGADLFAAQRATLLDPEARASFDEGLARVERLVASLLAKPPQARPTLAETLRELQAVAAALSEEPYTPPDYPRTPDHERIFWQGWAIAYRRFGLYNEALPRIERALSHGPTRPAVLGSYADILAGLGRGQEAVGVYQQALTATQANDRQERPILLNQLGCALTELGRYAEAEAAFAEQLALTPGDAEAWYNRALNNWRWAQATARSGSLAEARATIERALGYVQQAQALNPADDRSRRLSQALRQLRDAQ